MSPAETSPGPRRSGAHAEQAHRIAYMDLARSTLLVSGVLLHLCLLHTPGGLILKSAFTSEIFEHILTAIRSFRMPSLFLVSGYFSALLIERKGLTGFLRNRMLRMGVPFLFCGLVLNSVMVAVALTPHLELSVDHFLSGSWQFHLWNIGNLIAYELFLFALFFVFPKLHVTIRNLPIRPWAWVAITMASTMILIRIWRASPEIPFVQWLVHAQQLFELGGYYLAGYLLHQGRGLVEAMVRPLPAFGSLAVILATRGLMPDLDRSFLADRLSESLAILYSVTSTLALFALLRWIGGRWRWVRALSQASYSIYLLHMPLMLIAFRWTDGLGWGLGGVILLGAISFLVPWLIHVQVVERWRFAGLLLNGKDYRSTAP